VIRTANLTLSVSRTAGGLFESVRRLVQSLDETGMDVRVFGVRDEFSDSDLESWRPVQVQAFKPTWPKRFGYSPQFLEELSAYGPDITHTHGIWVYPGVATTVYGEKMHHPYLISAHGMLDPWAVRNSRWKKVIAHWLYEGAHLRSARCLRALCEPEARAMRDLGLKNDIAIIPNGIDLASGPQAGAPPWAGSIQPGKKVLLFLSRIHPKKGLANLLTAWSSFQKAASRDSQTQEWVLAIAGWDQGGHEQELKQLATGLGITWLDLRDRKADSHWQNGNGKHPVVHGQHAKIRSAYSANNSHTQIGNNPPSVLFLGPQFNEDKVACYSCCDAFILPSFSEGVPMVVLEAWVNRKPVLMTPHCNLAQGFSAGAALKIEPTPDGILAGLNDLLRTTESERIRMGERGHALAANQFAWRRIAEQMTAVYEWILGGGARPACMADF
jgi:poly(glycerol-phosphate) alpha-glucosyltransferase